MSEISFLLIFNSFNFVLYMAMYNLLDRYKVQFYGFINSNGVFKGRIYIENVRYLKYYRFIYKGIYSNQIFYQFDFMYY